MTAHVQSTVTASYAGSDNRAALSDICKLSISLAAEAVTADCTWAMCVDKPQACWDAKLQNLRSLLI